MAHALREAVGAGVAMSGSNPIRRVFSVTAIGITNRIKRSLHHVGGGRIYTRGGISHQASAPGEAPASDLGRLAQSYVWVTGVDERGPYFEVGTNSVYAPPQEYGTSTIEPRPHFRPAVDAELEQLAARTAEAVGEATRHAMAKLPKTIVIDT